MAPTTRRQQKRWDAVMEHAGLKPKRLRPASPAEAAVLPSSKRSRKASPAPLSRVSSEDHQEQCRPARDTNTRCAFLALPRELRDEIYKHVLHSAEKRAVTLQNRNFITKSGLIGTNAQIRDEFLDAVLFHAPVIHTTVRNHNFAHIVTFLNRLSSAQFHKLSGAATPNSDPTHRTRSRKIIITLTYSPTKASTKSQLNRWLDRFDDPKRRGAEVRFEYRLDRETWRNGGYKQRVTERAAAGVRSREEARKIIEVTSERRRWRR